MSDAIVPHVTSIYGHGLKHLASLETHGGVVTWHYEPTLEELKLAVEQNMHYCKGLQLAYGRMQVDIARVAGIEEFFGEGNFAFVEKEGGGMVLKVIPLEGRGSVDE